MENPRPESLILRLKRKWFDAIAAGYKKHEYRDATEYWRARIEGQRHRSIVFSNGYGSARPSMEVEYHGWDKRVVGDRLQYVLSLGEVLRLENYTVPPGVPPPPRCAPVHQDESQLAFSRSLGVWIPSVQHPEVETVTVAPDEPEPVVYTHRWDVEQ